MKRFVLAMAISLLVISLACEQGQAQTESPIAGAAMSLGLQQYLAKMAILLGQGLKTSHEGDSVRQEARQITLDILPQLTGEEKGRVLLFLYRQDLIGVLFDRGHMTPEEYTEVQMGGLDYGPEELSVQDMRQRAEVWLEDANLDGVAAGGPGTVLDGVFILGASMRNANFPGANLTRAQLRGSNLENANFAGATLWEANLEGANLTGSDFTDAVIDGSIFTGSTVTPEQLAKAASAEYVTLPDGIMHQRNLAQSGGTATAVSPQGLLFLGEIEGGFQEYAYNDLGDTNPNSKCTIGYGQVLFFRPCTQQETQTIRISKEEARRFFDDRTRGDANRILELVTVPLSQNQLDALVSFHYNLGTNILTTPDGKKLLRLLNKSRFQEVPREMKLYNKSRNPQTNILKFSQGVQNRRCEEADLFERADYAVTYAYCPRAD